MPIDPNGAQLDSVEIPSEESIQHMNVWDLGLLMRNAGIYAENAIDICEAALRHEGIYNLMQSWEKEKDADKRIEIIKDIYQLLDAIA